MNELEFESEWIGKFETVTQNPQGLMSSCFFLNHAMHGLQLFSLHKRTAQMHVAVAHILCTYPHTNFHDSSRSCWVIGVSYTARVRSTSSWVRWCKSIGQPQLVIEEENLKHEKGRHFMKSAFCLLFFSLLLFTLMLVRDWGQSQQWPLSPLCRWGLSCGPATSPVCGAEDALLAKQKGCCVLLVSVPLPERGTETWLTQRKQQRRSSPN